MDTRELDERPFLRGHRDREEKSYKKGEGPHFASYQAV